MQAHPSPFKKPVFTGFSAAPIFEKESTALWRIPLRSLGKLISRAFQNASGGARLKQTPPVTFFDLPAIVPDATARFKFTIHPASKPGFSHLRPFKKSPNTLNVDSSMWRTDHTRVLSAGSGGKTYYPIRPSQKRARSVLRSSGSLSACAGCPCSPSA